VIVGLTFVALQDASVADFIRGLYASETPTSS